MQLSRHQCKESRIIKHQVNRIPPKETDKALVTNLKEMEINELSV